MKFDKTIKIFFIFFTPFVCFPSLYTLPFLAICLIYLLVKGYYLECLATLAGVKAFGSWYLRGAILPLDILKMPLLVFSLLLVTSLAGFHKKIKPNVKRAAFFSLFIFIGISFLSSQPALSILKAIALFAAYQTVIAISSYQKEAFREFPILFVIPLAITNILHGFHLWMPHPLTNLPTNLYSGVWMNSQVAGLADSFLFLKLLDAPAWIGWKAVLIGFLLFELYLTNCRTAMLALLTTLIFLSKKIKVKILLIIFGLCLIFIRPETVYNFINKHDTLSTETKGSLINKLYSTRTDLVLGNLNRNSVKDLFVGHGFGVGGEDTSGDREMARSESEVSIFGVKIPMSNPVEYGNIYVGAFGDVGFVGVVVLVIYFFNFYYLLSQSSRILFQFILIANFGEAIMLSPAGNPLMLFFLCMLSIRRGPDRHDIPPRTRPIMPRNSEPNTKV